MPNKGNLVRSISDRPTDIIHGKSKFYAFYVEMMFGSSRADYLQLLMIWFDSTDSTGARVNPSRFGFSKRKDHVVVVSTLARAFNLRR